MRGAVYGLLGESLAHSFSPQIHAKLAGYEYRLFEKSPAEVADFLRSHDFGGINVTIPYKKTVMSYCDSLSEDAQKIGSVNTIVKERDGSLRGYNTDYYGFSYMLSLSGVNPAGKKAVILGSGGASVTVRAVLEDMGARKIVTISRGGADNYGNIEKHDDAQIVVNTTPVGMYPGNGTTPVDLRIFERCEAVFDLIYNPAKTELMLTAEDLGIYTAGGLTMLTAQAKRASELFTGVSIPDEKIGEITDDIQKETMNIALIGMPGAGKSTVGAALAEMTGKDFADTDALVEKTSGRTIPDIITNSGEDLFRKLETDALAEISKRSGCVIATGGGIVTREINRRLLRQNCRVVFLDRPVEDLPSGGRPLSQSQGVAVLYEKRLPLYRLWSDCVVTARDTVYETAYAVKEALKL